MEKSAIELVAFNKTDILEPNQSEVVEVSVEGKYMASYDSYNAKTYILDKGDYYFAFGIDSHDAINNILRFKKDNLEDVAGVLITTVGKICDSVHYEDCYNFFNEKVDK